jgi:2-C-methyl-D-erythritol 4-phosphate cytidylyltransferase/2-C-methyl-D-erythritol 2,4-cyclodiphosphate synthase
MNIAIILAFGKGVRLGDSPKQFQLLAGKPMWQHSADIFEEHPEIDKTIIISPEHIPGGSTRQESAAIAARHLQPNSEDLLIFHNAANPFVTSEEISQVIMAAQKSGAAYVAHPVISTLRTKEKTLNRNEIYAAETPQVIRASVYLDALDKNLQGTDEMMLAEQLGLQPQFVPASKNNFKITTTRDLEFARFLLEGGQSRTGIGQDSHRFHATEKGLTLGGLLIQDEPRMIANSDGDVIIHALCNAILQALGQGSFSAIADPLHAEGVTNSREYLRATLAQLKNHQITHVGLQLEGSRPQIDPLAHQIRASLADLLSISESQIGLTATTGEDLTPFGRGEGLQCLATVTLQGLHAQTS